MKKQLPRIGLRSMKTAIATTLCAVFYIMIDRNATFACIGAVFGMENSDNAPWKTGLARLIGTILGGFLGIGLHYVQQLFPGKIMQVVLLLFGIILLIYISQLFGCANAIQGGAVVFYIVMLNTPSDQYIVYAINRMIDTAFGVSVSVAINIMLSRERIHRMRRNMGKLIRSKE